MFSGFATAVAVIVAVWLVPAIDRPDRSLPDYGDIQSFDPEREGGHLLPNLDEWMRGAGTGTKVKIVTNSKGFRNRTEFSYDVPPSTLRILIMGDSFVDGMRTDQDSTIGAVLERDLKRHLANTRYTECQVMVSGHNNPADSWYGFQEHCRKYSPSIVVVGITLGNDLSWQGYGRWLKPATTDGVTRLNSEDTAAKTVVEQLRIDLASDNSKIMLPPDAFDPPSVMDRLTGAEMKTRIFLSERFGFAGYSLPLFTAPWWSRRRQVYAADVFLSLGLYCRPSMPEVEKWYRTLEEVLMGFNGEAHRSGSKLVVILFPGRIQVSSDDWTLTRRAYCLKSSSFDLDYPSRRIRESCERIQLPCLDLQDSFRDRIRAGGGPLFRPRADMHFDEAGQRLAGEELSEFLLHGLIQ